jgi:serine/threonine protein phosphatase PrpC
MTWQITYAKSLGTQAEQQDHGNAWTSPDGREVLVVVADGAGGHHGGRHASSVAVEAARKLWETEPPRTGEAQTFLEKISLAAHAAVAEESKSRSTWLALLASEKEACWVHSGDSRLYHFTSGKLVFRTLDHSLVQSLVETGSVEASETSTHADRNVLLQSLGGPAYIPVDFDSCPAGSDDLFILCTDGVWNELEDGDLLRLARCLPADRAKLTRELVEAAVRNAGKRADNASLWCVAREDA